MLRPSKRGADCPKRWGGGLHLGEPKSDAGRRVLTLPPSVLTELKAHRRAQVAERLASEVWEPGPRGGWVFANPTGGPLDPRADARAFKLLCVKADVPARRLHDLRHSAATMMLENELDLRTAGAVLGHSQVSQTARYSHVLADRKAVAAERIERLRLDPRQKAGKMSGGQRAQLALTMAIAKNPELLIMDEPIASLDPLARSDFLRSLADFTAARQVSVVLSSHLLGDLERICDYLIVLVGSRVQVAGEVSDLLASHRMLTGVRADPAIMPPGSTVISASRDGRPRMVLARVAGPVDETAWPGGPITLEDLVLAYMSRATDAPRRESALKGQS